MKSFRPDTGSNGVTARSVPKRIGRYRLLRRGQRTFESAKEELDHLLREAVREHLLSDVPLGVWLSGGIDSSTILHYAAEASSSRLKTLSISFRGRSFDESSYIQQVAAQYGTDHEQFDLNTEVDLCGAIEEFAYYSDEPTADAGALPVWFLSKMSKTKVTVTLSGEGADEVFGGYLTYRANQFARNMRCAACECDTTRACWTAPLAGLGRKNRLRVQG